jgi:hypothetical protein
MGEENVGWRSEAHTKNGNNISRRFAPDVTAIGVRFAFPIYKGSLAQ